MNGREKKLPLFQNISAQNFCRTVFERKRFSADGGERSPRLTCFRKSSLRRSAAHVRARTGYPNALRENLRAHQKKPPTFRSKARGRPKERDRGQRIAPVVDANLPREFDAVADEQGLSRNKAFGRGNARVRQGASSAHCAVRIRLISGSQVRVLLRPATRTRQAPGQSQTVTPDCKRESSS